MELSRSIRIWSLLFIGFVVIGSGIVVWWNAGGTELTVTGTATVRAAPDEYVFYTLYEGKHTDQLTARTQVTKTGNEVVAKLKELGVIDGQLTTNVSVNEEYDYSETTAQTVGYLATYTLTITVRDLALAKQVQEYLATTSATGSITPSSAFQSDTQKRLEQQARILALQDAKQQATETARTLGVNIKGIKSIGQPAWGGIMPMGVSAVRADSQGSGGAVVPSADFLVGEQEVSYSIQVIYRVR